MRGQLSHSISSSKAATMASAFWCPSLTWARLLSKEASLLPILGVLLLGGRMSVDWDLTAVSGASLCFCPGWSSKEDTTSSISSGSPGGDPGSLCSLYTSRYKDWISSLLVWGLPAGWWICLPQGPALAIPVGSLGGPSTPPPSAFGLQHVGTFHRASWGSGGYLPPTWSVPYETARHPSSTLPLRLTSPPRLPAFGSKSHVSFTSILLHQ